jgi:hypothetical protein
LEVLCKAHSNRHKSAFFRVQDEFAGRASPVINHHSPVTPFFHLRETAGSGGAVADCERGFHYDGIGKAGAGRRGDSCQQSFGGDHAHFAEGLADGGERGILVGGAGDVVEAYDGNVLGNF